MSQAILKHVSDSSIKKSIPLVQPGQTVRVHQKIKEGGKERIQIFEGVVLKLSSGASVNKTFTVRKMVDGVGVEKIFPFFSPTISKLEVVKGGKVRRAKLYYMRDLAGKSARLRDLAVGKMGTMGFDKVEEVEAAVEEAPMEEVTEVATSEEPVAEEPAAEEAEKTEEA